ncbi:uncharacterized protein LOC124354000 [Homalodisca vitripennis]|uniref:uncharacterized protein LOC124354000 n=1 Tax=Homalodisca vitripennis TaxID=197043 RepID=UPI001EEB9667|nr:uncharacterized protein LOC124354000 [Homalodisca vitripennis]
MESIPLAKYNIGDHLNPVVRIKRLTEEDVKKYKRIKRISELDPKNNDFLPSPGGEVSLEYMDNESGEALSTSGENGQCSSNHIHNRCSRNLKAVYEDTEDQTPRVCPKQVDLKTKISEVHHSSNECPKETDYGFDSEENSRSRNEEFLFDDPNNSIQSNLQFSDSFPQEITTDLAFFDEEILRFDHGRMLTDEEVWDGLQSLNSENVLVLPPSVCLKVRLLDEEVDRDIFPEIDFNTRLIIAPISNAQQDDHTGFNTEGSHWSLVVVDLWKQEYLYLDSIPRFNYSDALEFCKNANILLGFKHFKFIVKECRQQNDGYSCGLEVMKNAREQVELLKHNLIGSSIMTGNTAFAGKPKLVIMGDYHAQNIAELLQQIVPQFDILSDCCQGASVSITVHVISVISKFLREEDCILVITGTEETKPRDYPIAALHISEIITKTNTAGTLVDEVPSFRFCLIRQNAKCQKDSDESLQDNLIDSLS